MNREIKFRVWDRALNKMITKENIKGLLDTVNTGDCDTDYTYSRDEWYPAYDILTIFDYFEDIQDRYIEDTSTKRFELMQYTGLHDKNGKEIYEGDIISNGIEKCVVVWIEQYAGFMLKLIRNDIEAEWTNPIIDMTLDDEVIGNIYDNPDLLEKGAEDE